MKRLALSYGGEVYDRTLALLTGRVAPAGIDLTYVPTDIESVFWRQSRYREWDLSELSFGVYLATMETSPRPFQAIPIFPSRAFRHNAIYVAEGSTLSTGEALAGARIGTPEWTMTASLWMRGILADQYGVALDSVRWFTGGLDDPGREERVPVGVAPGVSVTAINPGETLTDQLVDGRLDAVIAARPPRRFLEGGNGVRRLFADPMAEERAFHAQTGVVPIMHLVAIQRHVVDANPWVARNLYEAFHAAKAGVAERLRDTAANATSLIWQTTYADSEQALIGDPFAYGAEENAAALQTLLRYAHEQGITRRRLAIEDLFHPSTLTSARV